MNPFLLVLNLLQNCEAKGTHLLILVAMACHSDMANVYLSQDDIAKMVNLGTRQVRRALNELVDAGYLSVLKPGVGRGNYTGYHINITPFTTKQHAI